MTALTKMFRNLFFFKLLYHGSCWASLHEYVDAADLPEDYGGFRERLDCLKLSETKVPIDETCNLFNLN